MFKAKLMKKQSFVKNIYNLFFSNFFAIKKLNIVTSYIRQQYRFKYGYLLNLILQIY